MSQPPTSSHNQSGGTHLRANSRASTANPPSSGNSGNTSIGVLSIDNASPYTQLTAEDANPAPLKITKISHGNEKDKDKDKDKDDSICGKRFELMKVNLAAFWDYSASFEDNCCAICRNALKEPCIECQALSLSECELEKAKCGHMFHYHCIMQWLQARSVCPLCNRPWVGRNTRPSTPGSNPNQQQQGLVMAQLAGMGVQAGPPLNMGGGQGGPNLNNNNNNNNNTNNIPLAPPPPPPPLPPRHPHGNNQ